MMYIVLFCLVVALAFVLKKLWDVKKALAKYSPIMNLDEEILNKTKELEVLGREVFPLTVEIEALKKQSYIFNEEADLISAGFYKSKYDFDNSTLFEDSMEKTREAQKALIKDKKAIVCTQEWIVSGSKAEGKKMTDRTIKLGLSAFNVQCDNEILKVRFNNIGKAEEKIRKIRENIDKLLEPNHCHITEEFVKFKLQELFLAYEYQQKLQAEKEEQKALREQMRDEEKALREAEKLQNEAIKEEKIYSNALEKAKLELLQISEAEKEKLLIRIADLEQKQREATEKKERAISMAQQTRRGHVYIISNLGSFGENVFKIGMTRRLDPEDRVYELSDASVPFDFDIHAMIETEDAPKLERQLHDKFHSKRLNKVNERKEFFNVELDQIVMTCKEVYNSEIKFTLLAEAQEFRRSKALV